MADPGSVSLEDQVHRAVLDADIGHEALFAGLDAIDAIEATVSGTAVQATVSLPIPAASIRDDISQELTTVLYAVDAVDDVAIRWQPAAADPGHRVDLLPDVKNVIAIASGKGGVGKSTVAANIAVALADAGASVGLLDADIYGPNAPSLLGIDSRGPQTTTDGRIVPREAHGVRVMSMDFIVSEDDPIIWRGPMVDDVLHQLTGDVDWGMLDYLLVDMPPGTGDAQLTLVQHLPVAGAVIVTTPSPVAVDDARRSLVGFARYDVPVLGIVENMGYFVCPDCSEVHEVFGDGGGAALAEEFELPVLGRLPIDPVVGTLERPEKAPGVTLPLIGRIGLPRTQEEREGRLPPVALREDGEWRRAVRETATRVAACVNAVAVHDGEVAD